jgi:hypothetical protein
VQKILRVPFGVATGRTVGMNDSSVLSMFGREDNDRKYKKFINYKVNLEKAHFVGLY